MKKRILSVFAAASIFIMTATLQVSASELLDVKPIASESGVIVEVTADIPMTYTYYKIPGEARAVVDIADVDPEKIEPLLVVNKGAVSSISVDKATISSMVVSRLVFNLVSESEIMVNAQPDRKKLSISLTSKSDKLSPPSAKSVENSKQPEVVAAPEKAETAIIPKENVSTPAGKTEKEEDPLGLDEPILPNNPAPAPAPVSSTIIAPVVPAMAMPAPKEETHVTGIVIGSEQIEIRAKSSISSYKTMTLDLPARLVIDIYGKKDFNGSSFAVKKFGIEKIRVGTNGTNVRLVFDTKSGKLPKYNIIKTENGLQIKF